MNLQNLFGITAQYLGSVETGENCLSVEKLITLSNKTNLSLDYILLGKANNFDNNIIKSLIEIDDEQIEASLNIVKEIITILKKQK